MATMAKDSQKDKHKHSGSDPLNTDSTAQKKGFFAAAFNTTKDTVGEFLNDNCMNLAAAVTYYALQSIIPLILGFLAVGSLFLQDPTTRQHFITQITTSVPQLNSLGINFGQLLNNFIKGAWLATTLSVLTLLWSGSGIFGQLIFAINAAFDVEKNNRNFIISILMQIGMLIFFGFLLIAAVAVSIIAGLIFNAKVSLFGISPGNFSFILPILSYLIPVILEAIVFSILFRISPSRPGVRWKPCIFAGVITAVLFEVLKFLFGLYVSLFGAANSAAKTYGAIGGIIVFLFFLYVTALVILFGAELAATMHNFKSGMASVQPSKEAVVETSATKVQNAYVPKRFAYDFTNPPHTPSFDYGTVENDPAAKAANTRKMPNYVATPDGVIPVKSQPVSVFVGGAALILAAVLSTVFGRKTRAL